MLCCCCPCRCGTACRVTVGQLRVVLHCAAAACVTAAPLVVSPSGSCESRSGVLLPTLALPPCCSSCRRRAVVSRAMVCSCPHRRRRCSARHVIVVWLPPLRWVPLGCACTHNLMSERKRKKKFTTYH